MPPWTLNDMGTGVSGFHPCNGHSWVGAVTPFQLPILLKGTSDDDVPCPGYLFEEIASILPFHPCVGAMEENGGSWDSPALHGLQLLYCSDRGWVRPKSHVTNSRAPETLKPGPGASACRVDTLRNPMAGRPGFSSQPAQPSVAWGQLAPSLT